MRRRDFIAGALSATAQPMMARGQRPAIPVIGFIQGRTPEAAVKIVEAFRQGLREAGFVEGTNVKIEYRYAEGRFERFPEIADDLVRRRVDVIVAGYPSGQAAKAATSTIPIVFAGGGDPVRGGLVSSINRPEANITGVSLLAGDLETKRIGLLHELVPQAAVVGALIDPTVPDAEFQWDQIEGAGRRLKLSVLRVNITGEREFESGFNTLVREGVGALIVAASTFFNIYREKLVGLAARHAIPAVYELREFAEAGGLMIYGPSITDVNRQAGVYAGRILKGDKPGDLPILFPSKFEFILNLKTAKALGLTVPPGVLAIADEIIE